MSVDTLEPSARPWTPSYSVHAQGSPLQPPKELEDSVVIAETENSADNVAELTGETQVEEDANSVQAQDTVITEVAAAMPTITVDNEVVTEGLLDATVSKLLPVCINQPRFGF